MMFVTRKLLTDSFASEEKASRPIVGLVADEKNFVAFSVGKEPSIAWHDQQEREEYLGLATASLRGVETLEIDIFRDDADGSHFFSCI